MKNHSFLLLLYWIPAWCFSQLEDAQLQPFLQDQKTASYLEQSLFEISDLTGHRLMGSPSYQKAAGFVKKRLEQYQIPKVFLDHFSHGYRGWEMKAFQLEMKSPVYKPLHAFPRAYVRGTNGTTIKEALFIPHSSQVFQYTGQLQDKVVLFGDQYRPEEGLRVYSFERKKLTKRDLEAATNNKDPNELLIGYHARRSTLEALRRKEQLKKEQHRLHEFLLQEGAAGIIEASSTDFGLLHVDGWGLVPVYNKKEEIQPLPAFVLANDQFGQIKRLLEKEHEVLLKLNLEAQFLDNPESQANVIAEIPGSDPSLKNEWIVMGAHLDSWHAGTGTTDNAANCATLIESMRLIKESGIPVKRSIRLVLWGGHEQNFAGSRHYIESRIGSLDGNKIMDEQKTTSVYFNLDNGAGKIRGIFLMGNDSILPYFEKYLNPFPESRTLTLQNANQSDHELFDWMGIPAFQMIQDPLNYIPVTHHTNLDSREYLNLKDLIYNANVMAWLAIQAANENRLLPREPYNAPYPIMNGQTRIRLNGFTDAKYVSVVGQFNQWDMHSTKLKKVEGGWECYLDLPQGTYLYKFIVDGQWTQDPKETNPLKDGEGHAGLSKVMVH